MLSSSSSSSSSILHSQPHLFLLPSHNLLPPLPPPQFPTTTKRATTSYITPARRNRHLSPHKSACLISGIPSYAFDVHAIPSSFASPEREPDGDSPGSSSARRFVPKSISSFLLSCSSLKAVRCLHAAVVRSSDASVTFVGNNLISAYVRLRELDTARKLFDRMPKRNVVSWTAIISGYHRMGLDDEVLRMFGEMIENHVEANSLTYVCLLKSCGTLTEFELGKQIHARVVKGNWSNMIVDSALVYFYEECSDLLSASRVFARMSSKDVITWTTMITAHVKSGHGYEALSMFLDMQEHGFSPNEFTVCSVLKACGELKELSFGKQLHGAIAKRKFKQDVHVGSSLVNMYARCGEVLDARTVFDLMPKRNTITWTSMISGYSHCGLGEEAILLFRRMKRRRVFANNLTVVSILSACGSIGALDLGKEVHGQILKNSSHENIHIGSTLIWLYCKCGNYAYAARVLEAMPTKDVIAWTSIISGLASLGHGSEALEILNDMLLEGVEPNPFTYSSALKACSKLEAITCGKWIHAHVSKSRTLSNVFVGSALIDMYMRCGCTKDASRVFDDMQEHNLVSWKMMIIGYAKNGLCREALKLMYRMQEEGFRIDDYVLATVLGACGDVELELDSANACLLSS
ncbi:pentatricopeptide repeat-containing protein [Canna indica]|uniref:Pentatricopeptide repeat-containing protein n=1 Tax=Canna indica TaxID=4628 RepID=A0AAQ3L6A1_9LILI|nr:pentatricopeptide repeat-containing protein [Canna indica]